MDRFKFSTIAHSNHVICSPLSESKVDRVLSLINLVTGDHVLDVGCGKGDMLMRLCKNRNDVLGTGIDINAQFLSNARDNAEKSGLQNQLTFIEMPINEYPAQQGSFAAAMCIGSSQAYGDYRGTLRAFAEVVRPGGYILIGEGYWQSKPDPAYLEFLEATIEDYGTHADNVQAGVDQGLIPLYSITSNQDEWDHYEGLYCYTMEHYLYTHPDDPDAPAMRQRIRQWREAYHRWGRGTLGFGLYLFMRP